MKRKNAGKVVHVGKYARMEEKKYVQKYKTLRKLYIYANNSGKIGENKSKYFFFGRKNGRSIGNFGRKKYN